MYSVSQDFLAAAQQSHDVEVRVDVTDPNGQVAYTVYVASGDVTADATRAMRRDCQVTVPDITGDLVPALASDLLSPLSGNEIRPYRGIRIPWTGAVEYVPLGVFPIREAPSSVTDGGIASVRVVSQDRSTTVSRNKWTDVFTIASGATVEAAIASILDSRVPQYDYDLQATGVTVPQIVLGLDTNNDPWLDAMSIANSAGFDLVYGVDGVARLVQPTDYTSAPGLYYYDNADSVIVDVDKNWDATEAFNGCVVLGESSTGTTVRGEAWDDDPDSPTYYLGPYGKYPEIITTPLVTTVDQAYTAAAAQLTRRRGVAQSLSWRQLVNPALDCWDVVSFRNTELRITTPLTVVIDKITIPLSATDAASVSTRSQQVAA